MPVPNEERFQDGAGQLLQRGRAILDVPAAPHHVAYLDGWRGVCILLVMCGHFLPGMGRAANAGVEFFFALSGFLMADILVFKRQGIAQFLARRVSRVAPALAAYVLLVSVLLNIVMLQQGQPLRWESPVAALLFVHNYLPHDRVVSVFEHSWSLAVEEHSYLLLVAVVLLMRRHPLQAAALAAVIALLATANAMRLEAAPYDGGQYLYWRSDARVGSVLMSFAMRAALRQRAWRLPTSLPFITAAIALVWIFYGEDCGPLPRLAWALLAAITVNSLPYIPASAGRGIGSPVLIWFGTLSYSIYVWQQLFSVAAHSGVPAALCVPLLLACALASLKLVENPARAYLNQRWQRRTDAHPWTGHTATVPASAG